MKLEHYPVEKLSRQIKEIVLRHKLENSRLFFFGSRVTGKNTERSDIDVGLLGEAPIPFSVLGDIIDSRKTIS